MDIHHCIQHIINIPHSVLTGDVKAHSTLWHSYTDNHRGQLIAHVINNSDHIQHTTKRQHTNHSAKHHTTQTSSPDITTIGHRGQLKTYYHLTTYPSSPQSTYGMTTDYNKTNELLETTRKLTGKNLPKTQRPLSLRPQYPPIYTLPIEC